MAKKITTNQPNIDFHQWCKKYKVSTKWDNNDPKNQEFIKKYVNSNTTPKK
jgi:hypothetical protein